MSEEFTNWLVSEGIRDELKRLAVMMAHAEFPEALGPLETDGIDWSDLILAGSILAQADSRDAHEAALRIATAAVSLSDRTDVRDAGAVLFGKLSNERSVDLAIERKLVATNIEERLGVGLRLEAQQRRIEGSILREHQGDRLPVNAFQRDFWDAAADRNDWVSASAPTASGKTWLVLQWLIDQLGRGVRVAIYLAPTRALVSEIEGELKEQLRKVEMPDVEVTSLPLPEKHREAVEANWPIVFVLTQERIHLLANYVGDGILADLLIVDEAHKIGDRQRGVILQDAMERLVGRNPDMRVILISPSTENPGLLLADAPSDRGRKVVDRTSPTVLQNLISARQKRGRPKTWELNLHLAEERIALGHVELAAGPGSGIKKLAFVASALGEKGGVLVYCNGASDAEKTAELIYGLQAEEEDERLIALSDLVGKAVHPKYRLAEVVKRGVGFHYGNMPTLVRTELERHFREGKLKYLVCTSTLVEGVNLSCRTIVVRGPRKGRTEHMKPHDFWNLAGRAGRWGREFQGNIVCLDPHDETQWPTGIPRRARHPIERETDAVLGLGDVVIEYLETRRSTPLQSLTSNEAKRLELMTAYLLAGKVGQGSIASLAAASRQNPDYVARLDAAADAALDGNELPAELLQRHPGVSAVGMQRLLDHFRTHEGDIQSLIPLPPPDEDSYSTLVAAMNRVHSHLFPVFQSPASIKLYALIIRDWLRGRPLSYIISKQIEYKGRGGRSQNVAKTIRETMELVESVARFSAPKYLTAYMDVVRLHLKEVGSEDLLDDGLDLGLALEFGVSSRTLLSLIELGLSRTTATLLYEQIPADDLDREAAIRFILERRDRLATMDIPAISLAEIARVLSIEVPGAVEEPS